MANILKLTFNTTASINDRLQLTIYPSWPSTASTANKGTTFKTTRVNPGEATIGSDAITQASFYEASFNLDYAPSTFTVSRDSNIVYITTLDGGPIFNAQYTSSGEFVSFEYPNVEVQDLLVRSPYIFITTGSNFDTTTYNIKAWEGDITDYAAQPTVYSKTKQKVVNTQDNIWINFTPLLREGLEANLTTYFTSASNYTSSFELGTGESKWARVETTRYITGSSIDSGSNSFFVLDGYLGTYETQGIPQILLTGTQRVISDTSINRLYFKNNNMVSMSFITNLTNTPTTCSLSTSDLNTAYVKSISVYNAINVEWVEYTWTTDTTSGTVKYTYDTECRHEAYSLLFKNKYGVLETVPVNKKSSRALTKESTDYLRSIVNYEGQVDTRRHTNKQFNVSGMEEYILNTNYLPEYMNEPITQLLLSEEVWLVDSANTVYPVTMQDNNLAYKTSNNDRLIQYTMKVKMSHNVLNNIQ